MDVGSYNRRRFIEEHHHFLLDEILLTHLISFSKYEPLKNQMKEIYVTGCRKVGFNRGKT